MKKLSRSLVMLMAVVALASCNSSKKSTTKTTKGQTTTKVTSSKSANGDVVEEVEEVTKKVSISVEGTVKEINRGKDGYTAKITDVTGQTYNATISIPNLKDPKQYRNVAVGDKINVTGETFKSGTDNYIVVRELKR